MLSIYKLSTKSIHKVFDGISEGATKKPEKMPV